jgi:hypothetical protein
MIYCKASACYSVIISEFNYVDRYGIPTDDEWRVFERDQPRAKDDSKMKKYNIK